MRDDITALLIAVLGRIPDWIRRDISSKEVAVRTRAEEALAAFIGNALAHSHAETRADAKRGGFVHYMRRQ